MAGYTWPEAPAVVVAQVGRLTDGLRERLSDNLLGVYLHGSLAMGGFNPERSDIDLLAVTQNPMTRQAKRDVARLLLVLSGELAADDAGDEARLELADLLEEQGRGEEAEALRREQRRREQPRH